MNSSTPISGRAPVQFAAPPASTPTVGVARSLHLDPTSPPSPPGVQVTTLQALHLAARQNNNRMTRSQARPVNRYPTRSHATARSEEKVNTNASQVASTSLAAANRTRKRRAAEPSPASPTTTKSPRKRARARATNLKKPPPQTSTDESHSEEPGDSVNCCICMCKVEQNDLSGINGCSHQFCFGCIEKWAERENTCPLCKSRFIKIDRKSKKRRKGQKNTKKVKQRDQRSDLVSGAALEGLLANFATQSAPNLTRLFLSGFGSIDFNPPMGHTRSFRSITIARGGDNSDDDESPLSSLFRVYAHNVPPMMPMIHQPVTFAARMNATRSYASNGHDRSAGMGAENPLTIDDSDDEDEIEQVWSASRRSS